MSNKFFVNLFVSRCRVGVTMTLHIAYCTLHNVCTFVQYRGDNSISAVFSLVHFGSSEKRTLHS